MISKKRLAWGIIAIFAISTLVYFIFVRGSNKDTIDDSDPQIIANKLAAANTKENNSLVLEFSNVTEAAQNPSRISVENAVICLDVHDRMPVNERDKIDSSFNTIFCWSLFLNGEGKRIRYIWYIADNITASQWLSVSSNKFRAWCPKSIDNKMAGQAHVDIVDENGRILKTIEFEIVPPKTSKLHAKYS